MTRFIWHYGEKGTVRGRKYILNTGKGENGSTKLIGVLKDPHMLETEVFTRIAVSPEHSGKAYQAHSPLLRSLCPALRDETRDMHD